MTSWMLPFYLIVAAAGNDDPAIALNNKALHLLEQGRACEAARTLEQAEALGPSQLTLSMIFRNEALALFRCGHNEKAEQRAMQAMALVENQAGRSDALLTPIINTLAEIVIAHGRWNEASAMLDRAIAIGEAAGAHYATALHNRAAVAAMQGDFPRAAELFSEALRLRRQTLGRNHAATRATKAAIQRLRSESARSVAPSAVE